MDKPYFRPRFSPSSWHSRVHRYIYDEGLYKHQGEPISICKYFWSTTLACFFLGIVAIFYPFHWVAVKANKSLSSRVKRRLTQVAMGFAVGWMVLLASVLIIAAFLYAWWLPFTAVGIGATVILLMLGTVELKDRIAYSGFYFSLRDWYGRRKSKPSEIKKVRPPRQPSMTMAFLRAKKAKVCPYIEWV